MRKPLLMAATVVLLSSNAYPLDDYCRTCLTIDPFQPAKEDIEATNGIYDTGSSDFEFSLYGNDQATIVVGDVPYSRYWQLEDPSKYVFHPMAWGRYVFRMANNQDFRRKLPEIVERIGVDLPNGGVAFYYPEHFPLNRMRGPDLMYSAISQSETLSGFLRYHLADQTEQSANLLERVKKGLFLRYEEGGVDLGFAQLEFPLFRSNPEIILNGWLHALMHLNDYAHVMNDERVSEYVHRNLSFFADHHDAWYDSSRNISRYSDTSPHRIIVAPTSTDQNFSIVYRAKAAELEDYIVYPVLDLDNVYSGFDFRILSINKNNGALTMVITCSTLYDTELVSDIPFSIKIRDGGYDPMRATPDGSGEWHTLVSSSNGASHHTIPIKLDDSELICGYPTNFSKADRRNYYHIQHIVALNYLAKDSSYEDDTLNTRLLAIAREWLERTDDFPHGEYAFQDPQIVLNGINGGKTRKTFEDARELLE